MYLRPFEQDQKAEIVTASDLAFWATKTEEEQLASVLNEIGPFLALGKPGQKLPQIGARRLYVDDDQWKDTVESLLKRCRLAVFRAGGTGSLFWEVEAAVKSLGLEHVVFLISKDTRASEGFLKQVNSLVRLRLPAVSLDQEWLIGQGTLAGYIYFTPQPEAKWVTFKQVPALRHTVGRDLEAVYKYALRPVYEQLGLSWSPPPRSYGFVAFLITSLIIGALGFALVVSLSW